MSIWKHHPVGWKPKKRAVSSRLEGDTWRVAEYHPDEDLLYFVGEEWHGFDYNDSVEGDAVPSAGYYAGAAPRVDRNGDGVVTTQELGTAIWRCIMIVIYRMPFLCLLPACFHSLTSCAWMGRVLGVYCWRCMLPKLAGDNSRTHSSAPKRDVSSDPASSDLSTDSHCTTTLPHARSESSSDDTATAQSDADTSGVSCCTASTSAAKARRPSLPHRDSPSHQSSSESG